MDDRCSETAGPDAATDLDPAAFRAHLGTYGWRHFLGETSKLVLALPPEHEGVKAVPNCQVGELIGPLVDRTAQEAETGAVGDLTIGVEDAADLRRIPACLGRRLIKARAGLAQRGDLAAKGRHPRVRKSTGEPQCPRAVNAEPDTYRMDRYRPGVCAGETVVRTSEAKVAFPTPDQANDVDCLLERVERVTGLATRPAGRLDGVPEAASTEPQLEAPAAQHVETGGRLGHDRRRASGRLATSGKKPTRVVAPAMAPSKAQVSTKRRWYG